MAHSVNKFARWILGSAILTWLGIHGVAKQGPAVGVDVALYVAMLTALGVLLATAEPLRSRRYTLLAGRRGGTPGIWIEPPKRRGGGKRRLRKRALLAERGIRALLAEAREGDPTVAQHFARAAEWDSLSEAERTQRWAEESNESIRHGERTMSRYGEEFASEALALRDQFEAYGLADNALRVRFEHPTNPHGIEYVAQCLGTWARKL